MNNKNIRIIALATVVIGAIISVTSVVRGFVYAPPQEISTNIPVVFKTSTTNQGLPLRILIPKIGVDAEIEHVGITFRGNMATPKKIYNTGWYKYGVMPGSLGSAVIDGHVDNGWDLPGVFAELKNLEVGDEVFIETDKHKTLRFVVVDKKIYPYKEVPLHELFNLNDGARLNLITCDGDWIAKEETDENRLIVYTRLVE